MTITLKLSIDEMSSLQKMIDDEALLTGKRFILSNETMFDSPDVRSDVQMIDTLGNHCDNCKGNAINIMNVPLHYNPKRTIVKEDKKIFVKCKTTRINGKLKSKKEDNSYYVVEELSDFPPFHAGTFCSKKCINEFLFNNYLNYNYRDSSILNFISK